MTAYNIAPHHLKLTAKARSVLRPGRKHVGWVDDPLLEVHLTECWRLCSFEDRELCNVGVCRWRYEGVKR